MDYYLKAESEAALWSALTAVGAAVEVQVKDEDGNVVGTRHAPAPGFTLDIVGTIFKPTGNLIQQTVGEMTVEVPEMAPLEGFHANMRGPADLAPKVEYVPYVPTEAEAMDPAFVMPEPEVVTTPSPLAALLVDPAPKTPARVWF
jgi:hypothetical protein